jgi:glycosyltransferase involved in cell wall biosynthesis
MIHPHHFLFAVWMVGGIQTVFDNLKGAMAKRPDANSSWLPIEMYPDDWITKIPPIALSGTWRNSMATWNRMRPLVRKHGPFDAAYFLEHSIMTFLWRFRKKVPYLLSTDMTPMFCAKQKLWYAVPEFDPATPLSRVKQAITRTVYTGAYRLLPWSTAVRDSMIEDYRVPEHQITVLPPGINVELWTQPSRGRVQRRNGRNRLNVLHVGWDFERKGGDLLVKLAAEPEFHDVDFHFVTSTLVDRPPPNVFVHNDLRPNSPELITLFRNMDIFALPTRADTFSMVALEAMSTGLPVIISNVGGIADIVVEGETGYLIPPGDIAVLRDRLRALASGAVLRRSMGMKGRRRVEQHFNLQHHSELVLELMTEAAHSRRKGQIHES